VACVLGINAIYHGPTAAPVDGHVVAAAEEERLSRRKDGKRPGPLRPRAGSARRFLAEGDRL